MKRDRRGIGLWVMVRRRGSTHDRIEFVRKETLFSGERCGGWESIFSKERDGNIQNG